MAQLPVQNVFRVKAAAAYLDVGQSTVWRWSAEGKLPKPIKLSARVSIWKKEWLDAFLEAAAARVQ
jgi:Predicted transcriptional regulator